MGILNEMFGDGESLSEIKEGDLLAAGDYVSEKEIMLSGYKEFRKRYIMKNLILRLFIVAVATASAVFMTVTSPADDKMIPVFCVVLCVFIAVYFISQNVQNKKKYMASLDGLSGIPYHVEIYTDKIKISDMSPVEETAEEVKEENETEISPEEEIPQEEENPTTVIHLDSQIVDLLEKENIFILVVRKAYLFIVPKSAFSQEDTQKVREKLSNIMGIRYKKYI
ncbi:MAG: YcxB family protein [Ruminococcus sp.]|nr:YcxB family protein [Ruminococcus sp.]